MTAPVDTFRALPPAEVLKSVLALREEIRGSSCPDDLKDFAEGLLTHLSRLSQDSFAFVDNMQAAIDALPQNHQGKAFLREELSAYLFRPPLMQEKIRDRLSKALVQKPAEPEVKKAKKTVTVSGRAFEFPVGTEMEA